MRISRPQPCFRTNSFGRRKPLKLSLGADKESQVIIIESHPGQSSDDIVAEIGALLSPACEYDAINRKGSKVDRRSAFEK